VAGLVPASLVSSGDLDARDKRRHDGINLTGNALVSRRLENLLAG
jgi:hypothetical protein